MRAWEIFVVLLILGIIAVLLLTFLLQSGAGRRGGLRCGYAGGKGRKEGPPRGKELLLVFCGALFFRLFVYLVSVLILMIFAGGEDFGFQTFLNHWRQWDATNYISIAEKGYGGSLVEGRPLFLVFFPLYAYGIRLFNLITGESMVSALLVSCLCYSAGCCYFYRLAALDYGRRTAVTAVVLLSVFPFGFFFGAMMSESLFFLLTAGALFFIRKHKWPAAALFGALASMTRMHGILLLVPAYVEMAETYRPFGMIRKRRWALLGGTIWKKALWPLLMGAGILYYLFLNYQVTGNAFQFTIYQREHWFQGPCFFTKTLEYVFRYAFTYDNSLIRAVVWIPEMLLFIGAVLLLLWALPRKKKGEGRLWLRHRNMYLCYFLVYLLLNYSITWLLSGGRYLSCALPAFLLLADLAERKRPLKPWLIAGSSLLCGVYLCAYLQGLHIM